MEFKTPKGTILPLLDLRGKPYLQVAHRLVWFREEHPKWLIQTEFVRMDEATTICKALIFDDENKLRAMAHKREDKQHFADHLEKSESSAIGRALAMIGFGTQFAPELDEEDRIVDTPIEPAKKSKLDPTVSVKKPGVIINGVKPAIIPWKPSEKEMENFKQLREKHRVPKEFVQEKLNEMKVKFSDLDFNQFTKLIELCEAYKGETNA